MIASKTIPAVAYLRMSTKKQEDSPKRQRERITEYAKRNGYKIVQWYFDKAISGDDTERRKDFLSMTERAVQHEDFDAVLVENMDRLSRDNSLKFSHYMIPLAEAGVLLVSVSENRVYNLDDPNDRALLNLSADFTRNRYLIDRSDKVTSALIRNAKLGKWPGGAVSYALRRMLVNERGEHQRILERGECRPTGDKFRGHYVVLVPGDPAKIERVRWMYDRYLDGASLSGLAGEMNRAGEETPHGGRAWRKETVRTILTRRSYTGVLVFGATSRGKYFVATADGVKPAAAVKAKRKEQRKAGETHPRNSNPFGDPVVTPGAFEPIIDGDTFDRVQRRLTEQTKRTTPHKGGGDFLLSGLLRCGHCGGGLYGMHRGKYRYRQYQCNLYTVAGVSACVRNPVDEDKVVKFLAGVIHRRALSPENIDRIRAEIERRLTRPATSDGGNPKRLRSQLSKLDREIERAGGRLARVPDDLIDTVACELQKMKREQVELAARLKSLQRPARQCRADVTATVDRIVGRLDALRERLQSGKPALVREVFRSTIDRIDVWCETVLVGRSKRYKFKRGIVRFKADDALLSGQVTPTMATRGKNSAAGERRSAVSMK